MQTRYKIIKLLLILLLVIATYSPGSFVLLKIKSVEAADLGNYRPMYPGQYSNITGGRGGSVYHVTKLAVDGSVGSLNWAVAQSNGFVVFDVGGYFMLTNHLQVSGSNLTIAGQSAPSPGVEIRCSGSCEFPLWITGDNVIVQHVATRLGDALCSAGPELDGQNIIMDHVSTSWQQDEGFVDWRSNNHLYWRVLSAEALFYTPGSDGCGGGGADEGHGHYVGSGSHNITIAQSLYASNSYRNPMLGSDTYVRFVNNLLYNWKTATGPFVNMLGASGIPGNDPADAWYLSYVGNRYIPGPATEDLGYGPPYLFWYQNQFGTAGGANRIYKSDNTCELNSHTSICNLENNQLGYDPNVGTPPSQASLANITPISSANVEALVVANAGARPNARTPIDSRIINYLKARQGPAGFGLISSISEVGGFPNISSGSQTWNDAASPNSIASGQSFRTNREMLLEQQACALEPDCAGTVTPPPPPPPSPSGTRVPSSTSITDSTGSIWTLGSNSTILQNGTQVGAGTKLLYYQNILYAFSTDNNWWKWVGPPADWSNVGATDPSVTGASSSGTRVPPATSITDSSGNVWTIGSNSTILKNGTQAGGGVGSKLLYYQNNLYAFSTDNNWWKWVGPPDDWTNVGATDPAGATPLVGDLDVNCIVNSLDWSIMNSKWFTNDATADLNKDGKVNAIDFSLMNANWGKTC